MDTNQQLLQLGVELDRLYRDNVPPVDAARILRELAGRVIDEHFASSWRQYVRAQPAWALGYLSAAVPHVRQLAASKSGSDWLMDVIKAL